MRALPDRATVRVTPAPGGRDGIALVTIDSPPVNAGSLVVRSDLLDVFTALSADDAVKGVILAGANGNFVAGSDIREFDAPPLAPHLPDVIAAIEAAPFPVVAAIEGAALGGGFELALGCDGRVAALNAVVGLPEVTLGLVPGAGGSQRLPRIVGIAATIDLVTSGRRVKTGEALRLGLVDAIADGDLIEAALARLDALGGQKRVLKTLLVVADPEGAIDKASDAARGKARGSNAVLAAIDVVKIAGEMPVEEALERERALSLKLRREPQSQALRHLFLAERAAGRVDADVRARAVKTVGIVGAGRMGQGIALAFAMAGYAVRMTDQTFEAAGAAMAALTKEADSLAARGRVASAGALTRLIRVASLEEVAECDLIVEAIFEDMAAKRSLFAALDRLAGPDTILASNTSYLDIDAIAAATQRPDRVAGLHFFNPAHVMRLVEVVRTAASSPQTLKTLVAVARRLRKIPVIARVGEGFIGNRIFSAYRKHAEFLLEEGALPEDVDRAMRAFGMAMGPFAVFDLAGLDIAWAMRKRLAAGRDPAARYVEIADRLCEAGRFGRKSGRGWFLYDEAGKPAPDPEVSAMIEEASARKGIARRRVSDADIQARLLAAIVNEAAHVLGEGVAERPSDIDLVLVNGYGFPALKGGPLHLAARLDRAAFLASVGQMVEAEGHGARVAPNLEALLDASRAV